MFITPKERYHDLDRNRVLNLISRCNIEIPIDKSDYSYFIKDKSIRDSLNHMENEISNLFGDSPLRFKLYKNIHISLLPDYQGKDNYKLGYSPCEIINQVFELLGTKARVKFDYSNPVMAQADLLLVKEELRNCIEKCYEELELLSISLESEKNQYTVNQLLAKEKNLKAQYKLVNATLSNIDSIMALYSDNRVGDLLTEESVKWRNLGYYLSVVSLRKYDKARKRDKDNLFLEYPYKFYERCSSPDEKGKHMLYPDSLLMEDAKYRNDFIFFNKECVRVFTHSPQLIEFLLHYQDNNKFTVYDTLKPGHMMLSDRDFEDIFIHIISDPDPKVKKSKTEKELIAERQLVSKVKFYSRNTEFAKHVKARLYQQLDNRAGYVGFVLDNNYVILDKFFRRTKNGDLVPASESAVYSLPLDLYDKLCRNSACMRKYIKEHKGDKEKLVQRNYHTVSESFTDVVLEVANRESVSRLTAEVFIKRNGGFLEPTPKTDKKDKKRNLKPKKDTKKDQ